jgi:hypothetical protein
MSAVWWWRLGIAIVLAILRIVRVATDNQRSGRVADCRLIYGKERRSSVEKACAGRKLLTVLRYGCASSSTVRSL